MKTYLNVPYSKREKAKQLGARWDLARRKWYVEDRSDLRPFLKWIPNYLTRPVEPSETVLGVKK